MLDKIAGALSGVFGLIDDVITTDEERMALKVPLLQIQASVISEAIAAESALAKSKASIIVAEAASDSWLTRSWRPIVMLTFTAMIALGQFGGPPVPEQMWPLLTLGLGGYVVGRSVEKTASGVAKALKAREE